MMINCSQQQKKPILKITFFLSSLRNKENNNNHVVDHHGKQQQKKKTKPYLCRVCKRDFESNSALNGHMRCHSSKKMEQNKNKSTYDHQDAIDLSRFLPPRTYNTNKRSKRFVIDDDVRDIAQSLLDMSRGKSLHFDVDNHHNNIEAFS